MRTVLYPKETNTNKVLFPDLRTQRSKCSIPRWATYVGLLGMPIKRQEGEKIYLFQSSYIFKYSIVLTFIFLNLFSLVSVMRYFSVGHSFSQSVFGIAQYSLVHILDYTSGIYLFTENFIEYI